MSGIVHCIEKALRGMTWRPYGLRSSETYPWRPVVLLNTGVFGFERGTRGPTEREVCEDTILPSRVWSARETGPPRVRAKRRRGSELPSRIMFPSNRPDFYVVTSYRDVSLA